MTTAIGVDIGGTRVKLGVVRNGKVLHAEGFPTAQISSGSKALEEAIVKVATSLRAAYPDIKALGVGVPGLVLFPQGVVLTCANVRGWKNVPLKSNLRRRLKLPVHVDNDVHAMALAEWTYGAGKGAVNLICVTLGTGVGGCFILNGRLYRSRMGPSAEVGHVAVGEKGPSCSCGGTACLERYVGNKDIVRNLRRRLESGAKSSIPSLVGGNLDLLTPEVIDRASRQGDRLARETWVEAGQKIGLVLANLTTLISPDKIVIGGGLAGAGKWLFDPIRETVRSRAIRFLNRVPVVPAKLGMRAGIIGSALLGIEALERKR